MKKSIKKPQNGKLAKPYPDFPLFAHASGHFGMDRRVDDLRPDDFEAFRKVLSKSDEVETALSEACERIGVCDPRAARLTRRFRKSATPGSVLISSIPSPSP